MVKNLPSSTREASLITGGEVQSHMREATKPRAVAGESLRAAMKTQHSRGEKNGERSGKKQNELTQGTNQYINMKKNVRYISIFVYVHIQKNL